MWPSKDKTNKGKSEKKNKLETRLKTRFSQRITAKDGNQRIFSSSKRSEKNLLMTIWIK